jgi:L-alanine-DL-glutamate epimerase-like enolase superfamily enzyme
MEITNVEAIPVEVPLIPFEEGGIGPYVTNHSAHSEVERILVRVDTDEGVSGWGEVRAVVSPAAMCSMVEEGVGSIVTGQSPFELEALRRQVFVEYSNLNPFFAPIEVACWDVVGKELDKPIYELLGGWTAPTTTQRTMRTGFEEGDAGGDAGEATVDAAYALGILPPEPSAERAKEVHEAGYSVLKTKAGRDWKEDIERVAAMHEAVDGELEFRLDPNQGWTPDQAVRVAAGLEDRGVYLQYMEQPIRVDAHENLAALRQRTRQPIAPNEDTYIPHNLRRMANAGAMDAAVIDLTPAGGITGLRDALAVCRDAGIATAHHCAFDLGVRTAAILHAVHGLPGFELPIDTAYYGWEGDVIADPFEIRDGALPVPQDPGLGVEVDMAAVDKYRI